MGHQKAGSAPASEGRSRTSSVTAGNLTFLPPNIQHLPDRIAFRKVPAHKLPVDDDHARGAGRIMFIDESSLEQPDLQRFKKAGGGRLEAGLKRLAGAWLPSDNVERCILVVPGPGNVRCQPGRLYHRYLLPAVQELAVQRGYLLRLLVGIQRKSELEGKHALRVEPMIARSEPDRAADQQHRSEAQHTCQSHLTDNQSAA